MRQLREAVVKPYARRHQHVLDTLVHLSAVLVDGSQKQPVTRSHVAKDVLREVCAEKRAAITLWEEGQELLLPVCF
jgi:hypothetical protein